MAEWSLARCASLEGAHPSSFRAALIICACVSMFLAAFSRRAVSMLLAVVCRRPRSSLRPDELRQVRARYRFRRPLWDGFTFRFDGFDRDQTVLISDLLVRFQ